jgi:putative nucleotidyltransferase with HDIG domain
VEEACLPNRERRLTTAEIRKGYRRLKERAQQSNLRSAREQAVFLFFLIVFIAVSIHQDRNSALPYTGEIIPLNANWTTGEGEAVDLSNLPLGNLDLTKDVSQLSVEDKSLCLKSIDTFFDVYADGQPVYSYRPVIPRRLGASYGMYVHTVPIPENTAVLSLRLEPVFPGTPATLDDVVIEDGGQYMTDLFRSKLFIFVRSTLILFVGLLFLSVGIFGRILMNTAGIDFISFGLISVLVGFCGCNDTLVLQVLTRHPSLIRVITYVCMIYIPYPAMSFFASATGNSHSRLVPASLLLCLGNFAVQALLTHAGISDYYYLVYISHAIILLTLAAIIYMLIRAIRQHAISRALLYSLIISLVVLAIGVGLDILRYYILQSYGSFSYTRLGMVVFALMMGIYLLREQTRALKIQQEEDSLFISELTTAFAKVIDMKDSYTKGHSSRVAKYTAMLARELGCDEETVEKYYRIALLHDVGKIGIPKAVLNKPGKLTEEEYEIIKSHTVKGYDTLKEITIMPELAVGARSHHERPDGRGYPNHLKAAEIPRVAQIIAVADCFDAMYSDRPYRKRMNFDKAVSIIREVSGTQLTTDVVDAFLRLVDKGEFRDPNDLGGGSMENIENVGQ